MAASSRKAAAAAALAAGGGQARGVATRGALAKVIAENSKAAAVVSFLKISGDQSGIVKTAAAACGEDENSLLKAYQYIAAKTAAKINKEMKSGKAAIGEKRRRRGVAKHRKRRKKKLVVWRRRIRGLAKYLTWRRAAKASVGESENIRRAGAENRSAIARSAEERKAAERQQV